MAKGRLYFEIKVTSYEGVLGLMSMLRYFILSVCIVIAIGCKQEVPMRQKKVAESGELSTSLTNFLRNEIFKDDLRFLEVDSTGFQYFMVDLNGDQVEEVFVRMRGSYFCKDSRCTYFILDSELKVLNKFVFMNAPVIATQEYQDGWRVLLTESDGLVKKLVNKNNRYPSNPKMALDSDIVESEGDIRMFDDTENPAVTYFF